MDFATGGLITRQTITLDDPPPLIIPLRRDPATIQAAVRAIAEAFALHGYVYIDVTQARARRRARLHAIKTGYHRRNR